MVFSSADAVVKSSKSLGNLLTIYRRASLQKEAKYDEQFCSQPAMSRGIGTGPGVHYDGYSFHGDGVKKDPRHAHAAIWPKFRSAAEDRASGGGFGAPPPLPPKKSGKPLRREALPMDPAARGLKPSSSRTKASIGVAKDGNHDNEEKMGSPS